MNSSDIKKQAGKYGARLCGIASIDRFNDAPKGFSPLDLYPKTQSVVAFAKQIPKGSLDLSTGIPYTVLEDIALHETHRIALEIVLFIENHGYQAVIVPSEPYEYWDSKNKTGKGLVSLKHIAYKSGLGVWGNNHLLYNPQIGNLMKIGAILTNAILEPDAILEKIICKTSCQLCISSCPSGALSTNGVNQSKCRTFSHKKTLKGELIYSCNVCRKVCPNAFGFVYNDKTNVYITVN
jgi:epoxyqueuosine reductase